MESYERSVITINTGRRTGPSICLPEYLTRMTKPKLSGSCWEESMFPSRLTAPLESTRVLVFKLCKPLIRDLTIRDLTIRSQQLFMSLREQPLAFLLRIIQLKRLETVLEIVATGVRLASVLDIKRVSLAHSQIDDIKPPRGTCRPRHAVAYGSNAPAGEILRCMSCLDRE